MRMRCFILLFGIVNACLFSALLPLWEGFDEAFHYGYVETLWQTQRLPVLGRTPIPLDVSRSFHLAPASHVVHRYIPQTTSYEAWFSLRPAEKERRREELELLPPAPGGNTGLNYEAQHPPLAYIVLALLDWPMSGAPITVRVLVLRLFAAVLSTVLLYLGATALCRTLNVPEPYAHAALFTIFCSEMLYATIAHVANDWLAVGLGALFLASAASFVKRPDRRSALSTAAWLAAGLLTKAYFLAFALLAVLAAAILIWRRLAPVKQVLAGGVLVLAFAGPWYARNLVLYKNISGLQEALHGTGMREALAAAPRMDWVATAGHLARGSLWTGNNSFTSFSRSTLHLELLLLLLALAAWGFRKSLIQPAEQFAFAAIVSFSLAIAYYSCVCFANDKGVEALAAPGPWYTQVLLAPVIALAYLGTSRWKRLGAILAACTAAIWTWVLLATWIVKLFPMYSGSGASPMRLRDVWTWYTSHAASRASDLSLLALAPAPFLYAGLIASSMLGVSLCALILRRLTMTTDPLPSRGSQ